MNKEDTGYLKRQDLPAIKKTGCDRPLDCVRIQSGLTTTFLGHDMRCYQSLCSTNDQAEALAQNGGAEGMVVLAEEQTRGKGRAGRQWHSCAYRGVWMSVILRPRMDLQSAAFLTQIASAAVGKTVERQAGAVEIKWPNDIYLGGKKLGGILTEVEEKNGKAMYMIVGIGINVNQDAEDFPMMAANTAISLKMALGREISREDVICGVLNELEPLYEAYQSHRDGNTAVRFCESHSNLIGKRITIQRNGQTASAWVTGLGDRGELCVRFSDGRVDKLSSGEITVRPD